GEPTDPDVLRCVGSILSQAVVYVRRNPVAERLGFSFKGSPADIDEAARHIAAFSLAGVRAVAVQRAEAERPRQRHRLRRETDWVIARLVAGPPGGRRLSPGPSCRRWTSKRAA